LPQWILDSATISSIAGIFVTIFLFVEARKIRKSFLRRARLPIIAKDLSKITSDIASRLKNWSDSRKSVVEKFATVKGLLENLKAKLPSEEQKPIREFLERLQPKKYLVFKSHLSELSKDKDKAWKLYIDLNTIVIRLEQLVKDSKWD